MSPCFIINVRNERVVLIVQVLKDELRHKILLESEHLFLQRGYDRTSLQMMADSGARLYFSDCPPGPDGAVPPPHQALTFTVGAGGAMEGTYLSIPD